LHTHLYVFIIPQKDVKDGLEFTASIISQLTDLWPECKLVHGKPRHPQSQGSVEWASADIKDMTVTWMRENSCKDWPVGIKFVQFQKNLSYHSGIKRTPYKANGRRTTISNTCSIEH
jgi:hypothetical protein